MLQYNIVYKRFDCTQYLCIAWVYYTDGTSSEVRRYKMNLSSLQTVHVWVVTLYSFVC
jgi:hypothetical protein